MREKFIRFMQGRNGVDQFSRFTMGVALVAIVLTLFTGTRNGLGAFLDILGMAALVYTYYRIFSKNISKRYAENQKFLNARYEWTVKAERRKKRFAQRKQYKFFKCPMCKQEVRVPRGHGKICITCPKCREQFVRRS